MKKTINIPSEKSFVRTAEIPEMIATSLYPDCLDEGPAIVTEIHKIPKDRPSISGETLGMPAEVEFPNLIALTPIDREILEKAWGKIPNNDPMENPLIETEWIALARKVEDLCHDLDWTLHATVTPAKGYYYVQRLKEEQSHNVRLRRAIESGEVLQLDPYSRIKTTNYLANGLVPVDILSEYVKNFYIDVFIAKAPAPEKGAVAGTQQDGETSRPQINDSEGQTFNDSANQDASNQDGITRQAIKNMFQELKGEEWRGRFSREKTNGLSECRLPDKGNRVFYDREKIANWVANQGKLDLAIARKRVHGEAADGQSAKSRMPTAHNPFPR